MELTSAIKLTQLFRDQAEHRRIDRSKICISMMGNNGSEISVNVKTPIQAAQYLKFLLKNDHPLFQRGERNFTFGAFPDPIIFKAWGSYVEPLNKMEFAVMSVRMRFGWEKAASELCFDDDFCRTDWDAPRNRAQGPRIHDFIRILEMAGDDWRALAFTTLRDRSKKHASLTLVPKA
jgi:hypothetical protein